MSLSVNEFTPLDPVKWVGKDGGSLLKTVKVAAAHVEPPHESDAMVLRVRALRFLKASFSTIEALTGVGRKTATHWHGPCRRRDRAGDPTDAMIIEEALVLAAWAIARRKKN
jgi:hypothetical protein